MSYKDKELQRAYWRRWYENNKDDVKRRARLHTKATRKRNREYVNTLKESMSCADCEIKYPHYITEFDHIGTDKVANVSDLVRDSYDLEKVKQEIAKCELVCANCHKTRTHNRRTT